MEAWWQGLSALNKFFVCGAAFFSFFFAWQLISTLLGLDLDGHGDAGADIHGDFDTVDGDVSGDMGGVDGDLSPDAMDAEADTSGHVVHGEGGHHGPQFDGDVTFSLVSLRSLIAFGTLFCWSGTLYLMGGTSAALALVYSFLWGLAAMLLVSYLLYKLVQLQEVGNVSLTAIGEEGTIYLNLPAHGVGTVRVLVGGAISYVKARSKAGIPMEAGVKVIVTGLIDDNTVEVDSMKTEKGE
jgi:membrane protein implicated in regulation of membrane protease activity